EHAVKLYTGWQGQAYLNYEQSPVSALPRPQFTFHTTAGAAGDAAYAETYQRQPMPKADITYAGGTLALTPAQGPVGTRATLRGTGLRAGTPLRLMWETSAGSRV